MTGKSAMHENAAGACGNRHVRGPEYDLRTADIACVRRPRHFASAKISRRRGRGQITAAGRCRVRLAARNAPSE
ncbi:hypothetical protein ELH75_20850 [Rhizobium leguminosarum]|nr:hypothetical protein ELI50_18060 [Rhizobium leguminosarum]TAU42357.1 hypothetical protein ELI51_18770 [Rhizobium leguminosarum]TAY39034.1 hypothetical protein ELH89_18880 [Rhizobium leguminosarum]TAZ63526.1 hypothetical protein ELH75_20850 [Rhizobium leguminosarum]TBZ63526.1 hypothetical protein E0H64_26950 [Rhizobium leguminosarum bv. viciae]